MAEQSGRGTVGVLGSGIAGLTCAYYLAREGYTPVVLGPGAYLGRLGGSAPQDRLQIDGFSNAIESTDTAFCGLLADLGGLGRVVWRQTRSGMLINGEIYPLSSPRDLLKACNLSGLGKLRVAAGLIYATQIKRYALDLDAVPGSVWLPRMFGAEAYERWCQPFMQHRFGAYADEIPAYWFWRQLNRYQTGRREVFGYLRGGIEWLTDRLSEFVLEHGGDVQPEAKIRSVETHGSRCLVDVDGSEHVFDSVISTLAPAELAKLAGTRLARELPDMDIPYQGRVTALVVARRGLGELFQTAIVEQDAPFQRIVQATRVVPTESLDGRHIFYLRNECGPHTDSFRLSDDVVAKQARESLARWFPDFDQGAIEAIRISRNPTAEPITTVGQFKRKLPTRIHNTRVYLCTSAQAYPRRTGWDSDVTLARETSAAVTSGNP